MRTTVVVFVFAALSAVANAGHGDKIDKVAHHVGHVAGAAEKVGNAVSAFNNRRSNDDFYARDFEDELYARDFEDELYARDFEDELYAREWDDAHWARGDFEDLFARAASEEDDLMARDIYDELY